MRSGARAWLRDAAVGLRGLGVLDDVDFVATAFAGFFEWDFVGISGDCAPWQS
jgi:hypothetical protein